MSDPLVRVGKQTEGQFIVISYQLEPKLPADEFIDVLVRSTLAERRPIDDRATMEQMLAKPPSS